MLTNCAFLLVFGKLYTFLSVKAVFLAAVVLFEVGSAVCGAAPNSVAFIIGRAIAGLGAAGVQEGIVRLVPFPFTALQGQFVHNMLHLAGSHCLCRPACKATPIPGLIRCGLWHLVHYWPAHWRRLHLECLLEMVLLHQPSIWSCGPPVRLLPTPSP